MAPTTGTKLAVLIDADNAQSSMVEYLLAEVAKYGTPYVKRAYGDWTGTSLKGWKEQLLKLSIQPIQQFAYTQGKNATDAAMIIDAMDLLYSQRFDGFCLVSSDSDFTRLASRIRESGLVVYGFGEKKTPKPFVVACDKFVYIENLAYNRVAVPPTELAPQVDESAAGRNEAAAAQVKKNPGLTGQLRAAVEAASDDDGWANLAATGHILTTQYPDFDPRTYGYLKLSELITASSLFEVTRRVPGEGKPPVMFIRDKRRSNASVDPGLFLSGRQYPGYKAQ